MQNKFYSYIVRMSNPDDGTEWVSILQVRSDYQDIADTLKTNVTQADALRDEIQTLRSTINARWTALTVSDPESDPSASLISGTITTQSGQRDVVNGVGTAFLSDLANNQRIIVGGQARTITSIVSNVLLTVSPEFNPGFSSATQIYRYNPDDGPEWGQIVSKESQRKEIQEQNKAYRLQLAQFKNQEQNHIETIRARYAGSVPPPLHQRVPKLTHDGIVFSDGSTLFTARTYTGPTGPSDGPPGPTGAQGLSVQGPTGPQGAQGGVGPAGAQGSQGAQGVQGVAGPTGPAGSQGPVGATGPSPVLVIEDYTTATLAPGASEVINHTETELRHFSLMLTTKVLSTDNLAVSGYDPNNWSTLDASLIDGNESNFWYNNSSPGSTSTKWPGIDLGSSKTINRVRLVDYSSVVYYSPDMVC